MGSPSSKISVLHVALNPITGPWSVMRELARAQSASGLYAGVGFALISFRDWPKEYEAELASLGLQSYRASTPKMFGTASLLLQRVVQPPLSRWGADFCRLSGGSSLVLHFHNAWIAGTFVPVKPSANFSLRCVATFHGVNADFIGQPIRHLVHRWIAQRLPRHNVCLTSVDSQNPQVAERLFGVPRSKFTVIPNGATDFPEIKTASSERGGGLTVGHVGTLNRVKGWRIAVEGVQVARATGRNIRLVVAGSGPDEADARSLAAQYPKWFEYAGFVHSPQTTIMPRLDAFVLMAEREGLPMAIIEAMSVGLPVIATPVGGIPDAVIPGRTGLLIARNAAALSEALCQLHDDSKMRAQMQEEARALFRQKFEISRIIQAYDELYRQVPANVPKGSPIDLFRSGFEPQPATVSR